jgi:TRAP-type C4-dicarboxylate transport system permease small subunit
MTTLINLLARIRNLLKIAGAVCLMGMVAITCADVVGRYLGHPIFGSVEIAGFLATLAAALALPYTHAMKGHIGVEILVVRFSRRTQAAIELGTNILSLVLFAVVTWRMYLYAATIRKSGEVSMSLEFPEHIIISITAFCFLIFTLTIVEDAVNNLKVLVKKA